MCERERKEGRGGGKRRIQFNVDNETKQAKQNGDIVGMSRKREQEDSIVAGGSANNYFE